MRTVPVIAADMTAYKFKPEDPGGIEVLHQDRRAGHEIRQAVKWRRAGVKLPGNTLTARNWCSAARAYRLRLLNWPHTAVSETMLAQPQISSKPPLVRFAYRPSRLLFIRADYFRNSPREEIYTSQPGVPDVLAMVYPWPGAVLVLFWLL
jgi:hypothetical protein